MDVYSCPAATAPVIVPEILFSAYFQGKQRADERTRTADLLVTSELLNDRRSDPRHASLLLKSFVILPP